MRASLVVLAARSSEGGGAGTELDGSTVMTALVDGSFHQAWLMFAYSWYLPCGTRPTVHYVTVQYITLHVHPTTSHYVELVPTKKRLLRECFHDFTADAPMKTDVPVCS